VGGPQRQSCFTIYGSITNCCSIYAYKYHEKLLDLDEPFILLAKILFQPTGKEGSSAAGGGYDSGSSKVAYSLLFWSMLNKFCYAVGNLESVLQTVTVSRFFINHAVVTVLPLVVKSLSKSESESLTSPNGFTALCDAFYTFIVS
jgi:hypothetical protein